MTTTEEPGTRSMVAAALNPDGQPLSVRLPTIQAQTPLGVFLAALFIASLVPIIGFLIFQRSFMRGGGLGGEIKG